MEVKWQQYLHVLRNDLNHILFPPEIVNAKNFGVPQNRERTIVEDE
jgi:DNA (cytosine-5)-methyltransferase 1